MDTGSLSRIATNAVAVTLPAAAPLTIPAWGPPAVELFGVNIPIMSMALSMLGLLMARGVSYSREGKPPGGRYLTGALVTIMFGLVVESKPTPGIAIAWGIGVGASGVLLVDLLRDRVLALFGRKPPGSPPPPPPAG